VNRVRGLNTRSNNFQMY